MQTIKDILGCSDAENELAGFINNMPHDERLSFHAVRQNIEARSGRFSEVEEILLLLESIFKRYKGEPGW